MAAAANSIQNFAFEEHLVRVVDRDGDPWFVGVDVCRALDLSKPENALATLDDDERFTLSEGVISDGVGRSARVIVSEPGVFRLVFRSRKPEAEKFKRWLAHDVLPQIRKTGEYALQEQPRAGASEQLRIDIARDAPLAARVDAVRLAKTLFGRDRARQLWEALGLPSVPEPSEWEGTGEAVTVMKMILDSELAGRPVRLLIMDAIAGNEVAGQRLLGAGIRVTDDAEGFYVSNTHSHVQELFSGSPWRAGEWRIVIRRLAGAMKHTKVRFGHDHEARATWFPVRVLDDWCGTHH